MRKKMRLKIIPLCIDIKLIDIHETKMQDIKRKNYK